MEIAASIAQVPGPKKFTNSKRTAMPAISDEVSRQALTDLVGIVCRNRDGVPWNASNLTQCIRRFGRFYEAMVPEGESATAGCCGDESVGKADCSPYLCCSA